MENEGTGLVRTAGLTLGSLSLPTLDVPPRIYTLVVDREWPRPSVETRSAPAHHSLHS